MIKVIYIQQKLILIQLIMLLKINQVIEKDFCYERKYLIRKIILANVKITGIMQKSNEVARSMAQLMKVEQFQAVSAQFSKELIKV